MKSVQDNIRNKKYPYQNSHPSISSRGHFAYDNKSNRTSGSTLIKMAVVNYWPICRASLSINNTALQSGNPLWSIDGNDHRKSALRKIWTESTDNYYCFIGTIFSAGQNRGYNIVIRKNKQTNKKPEDLFYKAKGLFTPSKGENEKRKFSFMFDFFPLISFVGSLIFFAFAFAFAWCEHALKITCMTTVSSLSNHRWLHDISTLHSWVTLLCTKITHGLLFHLPHHMTRDIIESR